MSEYLDMQSGIKNMLKKNYLNNRLSHAYIFHGEEGVGKSEMALYLTALLYSEGGEVDFNSPTTKAIYSHTFPNLYEVSPKKSEIVKESIEGLLEEFSKTSLVPGPRVFIIHQADKLNTKTSNMLLKFIEEPDSEDIHGIFITTNVSNILPTIISRCNLISFSSVDKNVLKEKILASGIGEDDADIIKELTNNISAAIDMVDDDSYQLAKELTLSFLSVKKEADMLKLVKDYRELLKPDNMKRMLEVLSLFLEDMMYENPIKLTAYKKEINAFKKLHDKSDITKKLEMVLEYIKMITAYVATRNVLFDLVASWYR